MPVDELDAHSADERARFVALEHEVAQQHPLYVLELDASVDEKLRGDAASFDETELALFVAYLKEGDGTDDVARCAAIINRRWQRSEREPSAGFDTRYVGFIGFFAAHGSKDPAAAKAILKEVRELLTSAEDWLRARCVRRVIAPSNGNALLGMGLLTDAYSESPMYPMPWHPRYYKDYLERAGYAPRYPVWFYDIDFGTDAHRRWRAEVEEAKNALAGKGHEFKVDRVRRDTKKNWDDDIEILCRLFNEGFRGEWEVQEHTLEEFREFYPEMLRDSAVLHEDLMLLAKLDAEPIGFAISFPDWTPLLRSLQDEDPASYDLADEIKAYHARFGTTKVGLLGGAFRPGRLEAGYGAQLALDLFKRIEGPPHNLPGMLGYWVNHANMRSRGLMVDAGGKGRILYHCYDKIFC